MKIVKTAEKGKINTEATATAKVVESEKDNVQGEGEMNVNLLKQMFKKYRVSPNSTYPQGK